MPSTITGKQCRAARALLGWTIDDLASNSGLARGVILRLEKEDTGIRDTSLKAVYKTFSKANIEFVGQSGVSEKNDSVELLRGKNAIKSLWENIIFTLGDTGGEILITNVNEKKALENTEMALMEHLRKLEEYNITERLLSCEGDTNFIMPIECYRWLPEDVFGSSNSTYVYGDKVAIQLWNEEIIVLIHSIDAAISEKKHFEYLWKNGLIPQT